MEIKVGDTVMVRHETNSGSRITTGTVEDKGYGLEVDHVLLDHPGNQILSHHPAVAPPAGENKQRQVLDINGTRSSVSIAEDTLIVIEDHHPDLWCEVSMTRHYDVDTARQHAKQILDRCDRIEKLRADRLAEQTVRADQ